jgi:hypothetical protein
MATQPFLLICAFPFAMALPVGVMLTAFQLERGPSPAWLGLGLALMAGGVLLLELSYRFLAEVGGTGQAVNPPGGVRLPLGRMEALVLQGILVLGPMVNTIGMYGLLMEMGQVHFRVCLYAYLGYVAGAVLLLATRRLVWTTWHGLYLRWGWVATPAGFNGPGAATRHRGAIVSLRAAGVRRSDRGL